jgi:hypothetical protein
MTVVASVTVGDPPAVWSALGFAARGDRIRVGGLELCLGVAPGPGLRRVTAVGEGEAKVDGLAFGWTPYGSPAGDEHPNGVLGLDHVVVATDDLERTTSALQAAGFELRRVRERARQAFLLAGPCILEVVEHERASGAAFWGLAFVANLDTLRATAGELVGDVRDAVQPGRRIATLRGDAGSSVPVAFLSRRAE